MNLVDTLREIKDKMDAIQDDEIVSTLKIAPGEGVQVRNFLEFRDVRERIGATPTLTYGGVNVVESPLVPKGMMVAMSRTKILGIYRYGDRA